MFIVAHVDYVRAVSLRPLGPETTELKAEWLFPQETLNAPDFDLGNVVDFASMVIRQDGEACEMNQRGLRVEQVRARNTRAAGICNLSGSRMGAPSNGGGRLMNIALGDRKTMAPENWDRRGLPAWTYRSESMLELEKREVFHTHWQIAGHVNDVPKPGDYLTFDIGEERALVIRGEDGVIRAFNNLCRHRGARVAPETQGHCKNALVCPFHGWVYNLDGTLRGPAKPKSFGDLDRSRFGLKPIESEIWHGFIFVRFRPGPQPPVAELLSLYDEDLADYRIEELVPSDRLPIRAFAGQLEVRPRRGQ